MNSADSKNMLKGLSFCIFDLETTGGNHIHDKIIEIGMVKIENLKITEEKSFLINPEKNIPDFIQKLTSIHQKDVESAPKIDEVIDEILEFMGESILVAHNISFDIPFFNSVLERLGKPKLENKTICTNLMTKYLIPNLLNTNLNYMSKIFGIQHKKAHRALDDAKASAKLLLKYLDIFIDKKISKINHLYYPRNRFELDRINIKKEDSIDVKDFIQKLELPHLVTIKGQNGVIVFSLCSKNSKAEQEYLLEQIANIDWQVISIHLFSTFIEALIHFNLFFARLENNVRNDIMKFYWKQHLPGQHPPVKATLDDPNISAQIDKQMKEIGDFLIVNHLVPEQNVIYPIASLVPASGLIFRYPGHQKKLIQYITSKANRLAKNKMKKISLSKQLKEFMNYYLILQKETSSSVMLFDMNLPTKDQQKFIDQIEAFLAQNPNTNNYPKKYI